MNIERIFTAEDLEDIDEMEPLNCPFCLKVGLYVTLGPKILMPGEVKPLDYDSWLQCGRCAELIPIYNVKHEQTLEGFAETTDNPFDNGPEVLGVHKDSKTHRKKKFQRKPQHRDKDVQREIDRFGEDRVKIHFDSI